MPTASHYVFKNIKMVLQDDEKTNKKVYEVVLKYSQRYSKDEELQAVVANHVPRYINTERKDEKKKVVNKLDTLIKSRKWITPGLIGRWRA